MGGYKNDDFLEDVGGDILDSVTSFTYESDSGKTEIKYLHFAFSPIGDDGITISVMKKKGGDFILSDDGELEGAICVNLGKTFDHLPDVGKRLLECLIDMWELKFENGCFFMETDRENLRDDIIHFVTALIQISVLFYFM